MNKGILDYFNFTDISELLKIIITNYGLNGMKEKKTFNFNGKEFGIDIEINKWFPDFAMYRIIIKCNDNRELVINCDNYLDGSMQYCFNDNGFIRLNCNNSSKTKSQNFCMYSDSKLNDIYFLNSNLHFKNNFYKNQDDTFTFKFPMYKESSYKISNDMNEVLGWRETSKLVKCKSFEELRMEIEMLSVEVNQIREIISNFSGSKKVLKDFIFLITDRESEILKCEEILKFNKYVIETVKHISNVEDNMPELLNRICFTSEELQAIKDFIEDEKSLYKPKVRALK